MLLTTWSAVVKGAVQEISTDIIAYMPKLFFALAIFFLGWVAGAILGRLVAQIIKALRIDNHLRETGLEEVLGKAGFKLDSGRFLGGLVRWFTIIIFLVPTLEILQLTQVNDFLQRDVLTYLPNVIAAVLILLLGAIIADFLEKVITGSAKAAELPSAKFIGSVAKWAIWIFAILAALGQLNVATAFVETLFRGIVIAFSLAIGLAFGLGGQETAARYIEGLRKDMTHEGNSSNDEKHTSQEDREEA